VTDVEARCAELRERLTAVRARIEDACAAAGREPGAVTLVAVTKTFPASDVRLLSELGVRDVGENRDQEAAPKAAAVAAAGTRVRWHFVGQLQRNKCRSVATYADAVHSVDRSSLVDALSAAAGAASFPGNGGFGTSNGHSAGTHARDAAAAERAAENHVAAEPAASLRPSPGTSAAAPEPDQAAEPAASRGEDATWSGAPESDVGPDSGDQAAEPVPAAAVPARHRTDPGAAARMFDAATTTRRRSVVFEEDDDLDVPDFLK